MLTPRHFLLPRLPANSPQCPNPQRRLCRRPRHPPDSGPRLSRSAGSTRPPPHSPQLGSGSIRHLSSDEKLKCEPRFDTLPSPEYRTQLILFEQLGQAKKSRQTSELTNRAYLYVATSVPKEFTSMNYAFITPCVKCKRNACLQIGSREICQVRPSAPHLTIKPVPKPAPRHYPFAVDE